MSDSIGNMKTSFRCVCEWLAVGVAVGVAVEVAGQKLLRVELWRTLFFVPDELAKFHGWFVGFRSSKLAVPKSLVLGAYKS